MTFINQMLIAVIAGAVTENLLFTRALGVNKVITRSKSYRNILAFGALYLLNVVIGGIYAWELGRVFGDKSWWNEFRGLFVLISIILSYFTVMLLAGIRKIKNARSLPIVVAFNSASFGAVYFAVLDHTQLLPVITHCIGCAVGITADMILVHSGRERLEMSGVPKAFSGMPIILIYIGILGLAFYGMVGHRLPT